VTRLNALVLAILVACGLSLVTSQHQARKLFAELAQAQEQAQELDIEWGQLQLEQRTWATHSRVEQIATRSLGMRLPERSRVRVLTLPADSNAIANAQ